jgi:hypothetical protein
MHVPTAPLGVHLDGVALPEIAGSRDALVRDGAARGWSYSAEEGVVWIKPDEGWRLGCDQRGASDPEQDTLIWSATERPSGEAREIIVSLASPAAGPQGHVTRTPKPYPLSPLRQWPASRLPDRLCVVANPPERIALRWGDWLLYRTNLYVSLRAGEQTVREATNVVRMDVVDADGSLLRSEEKQARRGRVEFPDQEYRPGEWTFRFFSDGLQPCAVTIRPALPTQGITYGPEPG